MNQTINTKFFSSPSWRASLIGVTLGVLLFVSGCGQEGEGGTDPLLGEFTFDIPIAYVKRPVDQLVTFVDGDNGNSNPRNAHQYKPGPTAESGGNLFVREFASNTAKEYNLTLNARGSFPGTAPEYDPGNGDLTREAGDVSDPDVSYDGKKIVFAFRPGDPPNTDPDLQSKWDLWEYEFPTDDEGNIINIEQGVFRPVIPDTISAQVGNDIDPVYLPDGSVVFSSDRVQRKADLLAGPGANITEEPLMDESNREPAVNLHIINPGDSSSIIQISFNQSHELDPAIISSGKIVYTRWEHASRGEGSSPFPLFEVMPDGTENGVLYGAHSFPNVDTGVAAFLQSREAQGGSLIATRMSRIGTYLGGDLVKIDYKNFIDVNTPKPNSTSTSTEGHVSITNITPLGGYSSEGRFATPFPLWDDTNRTLVAWAFCEVQDQNGARELCRLVDDPEDTTRYSPAPPAFGIWVMQPNGVTMEPIVLPEEGWSITDPIAIVDRIALGHYSNAGYPDTNATPPACVEDPLLCSTGDEYGLLKIASVYDADDLSGQGLTALRGSETLTCVDPSTNISGTCAGTRTQVSISSLQDAAPDERPVRFMRVVGPALVIDGTNSQSIREILGYHVVEPDGSVVMRVPAGRPFSIELVDKLGHRFSAHPQTWLSVQTGEVVECNGCHAGHTQTTALNQGAVGGAPFSGTDSNSPVPEFGETMAETLDRVSCLDASGTGDVVDGDPGGTGCLYRRLSGDIAFRDIWNDPDPTPPNDGDFSISYYSINLDPAYITIPPSTSGGPLTKNATRIPVFLAGKASQAVLALETNVECLNNPPGWNSKCQIAINYETHIQSIWEKSRWLDPLNTGTQGNYPCIRCHREFDRDEPLDNPVVVDIPDGQLSLTRTGSHQVREDTTDFESFVELTENNDVMLILDGNGTLVVAQKPDTIPDDTTLDPNDTITVMVDVSVNECTVVDDGAPDNVNIFALVNNDRRKCGLSNTIDRDRGGNRNYGYFYNKMTTVPSAAEIAAGIVDHSNMLNEAELRMINEWIELGRRYWGDPFDQRDPPPPPQIDFIPN